MAGAEIAFAAAANPSTATFTIAINGTTMANPSRDGGKQTSPGYSVHGSIPKSWRDTSGGSHVLTKGDLVTWSLNLTFTGGAGASGNTSGFCRV